MKKLLIASALLMSSASAFAAAPGGPNCGWGNMIFEGNSGLGAHLGASLTNGTSGNATFGMTSGTNGCSVSDRLTYSGISLATAPGFLETVAHDMAKGQGEAIDALAFAYGIEDQADSALFSKALQQNFEKVFNQENISSQAFLQNVELVMQSNVALKKYLV